LSNRTIKVAEVVQGNLGAGRRMGEVLRKVANPGDILDFKGFVGVSNSLLIMAHQRTQGKPLLKKDVDLASSAYRPRST